MAGARANECSMIHGQLSGKVVVITGATSGIGMVTAQEAAKEGAQVIVSGRRAEKGATVVDGIKAAGGDASFVQCDVTSEESVKNLFDKAVEIYGRVDGAFNNAGWATFAPIAAWDMDTYQSMYDTNVKGVMLSTKYAAAAMALSGGGSIVNHASIAAVSPMQGCGIYCSSKAAVAHFSKVAAHEFAPAGVRVNVMDTGMIPDTEIGANTGLPEEELMGFITSVVAKIPMGRVGVPSEIAKPVVFLLSDSASYVTGTEMIVDGGYMLA